MVFGTLEVWLILPITVIIYYLLPARHRWIVLFTGSVLYIGHYSKAFLISASIYTIINYGLGIILGNLQNEKIRKNIYIVSLVINIGQLVFYKYINFLIDNLNEVASLFGESNFQFIDILVPIGISYYTFQCIGYLVNIYRKIEKPEKHLGYFFIYNMFFPKFLSGPIERSEKFLPQIRSPKPLAPETFRLGLKLIAFGLFKKMVIAERLSIIVNNVYGNLDDYTGFALIVVMLIQAIYIYTDFSGYTDIALGIANLFGISLTDNFNRPFLSKSISEFWRRWHMSLSMWCNDYIFKTIIFKRRRWGKTAAVYGVFVTFFIIGIWHGAKWTFIVLGLLQGIAINYEFFTKRKRLQVGAKLPLWLNKSLSRLFTYIFFGFSLIFFFSHSIQDSFYFVTHMFDLKNVVFIGNNLGLDLKNVIIVAIAFSILFIIELTEEKGIAVMEFVYKKPLWIRWSIYYLFILIIFMYGQFATTNFIYLKF